MESAAKDQKSELTKQLSALILGHPLRARIAAELKIQPLELAQLAEILNEELPRVTYHWRVLREISGHSY